MNFAVVFTAQQQNHLLYVQLFKTKRRYLCPDVKITETGFGCSYPERPGEFQEVSDYSRIMHRFAERLAKLNIRSVLLRR